MVIKIKLGTVDAVKKFVAAVGKIDGSMDLGHGRYVVDAKSIMGIFSLDLSNVLTLTIHSGDVGKITQAVEEFTVKE